MLMLVHWCGLCRFLCVDWGGEARAGSEGEISQQGGVLGVIGCGLTGRFLLAQYHAHLPVVAVPGGRRRAGPSLGLNKKTVNSELSYLPCFVTYLGSLLLLLIAINISPVTSFPFLEIHVEVSRVCPSYLSVI